ncbi:MAG: hypothetical protein JW934_05035 [Anaerolineae bacterium]|nr:hypothetical protein [Anaerolineae bacterium]
MTQRKRILIAVVILLVIAGAVLAVDLLQRKTVTVEPGSVPIYYRARLVDALKPEDLERLEQASFVDAEEGKTQEGWLLRDVVLLYLDADVLQPDTWIAVSSSSRNKTIALTWAEVKDEANMVMFDLSGRSTLKLVSMLERLDARDEWVQDVDKIEIE